MKLVENITKEELSRIAKEIGEAFVTNELFHEFGTLKERRILVLRYMDAYVKCVYESKALFQTEDGKAFIGLSYSDQKAFWPQIKMLFKLLKIIPFRIMKPFLKFAKEIENEDKRYMKNTYLEVLMVCVTKDNQGNGKARELVDFAKERAESRQVPLLFDTDMKEYAKMYQHLGCELYHTKIASNGVTRYNLVWKSESEHKNI